MGIFSRDKTTTVQASYGGDTATVTAGASALALSVVGAGRERAMALPTISRARDILASLIASLPIRRYGTQWNGEFLEEIPLAPEPWQLRPDPLTTRSHTLSWLFDDMYFYGRGYLYVKTRYSTGLPASFQWLPAVYMNVQAAMFAGNAPIGDYTVTFNGQALANNDVKIFYSPVSALLEVGARAINTAERLDVAAWRFATTPTAFGWLQQTEGEPLPPEFMKEAADGWAEARDTSAVAAISAGFEWHESTMDPARLQLVEARQHSALDLARLANVPPYLVGAPTGTGMTYTNAVDAKSAAVLFGALPYIEAIEQRLSAEDITPRGQIIRLDRSAWLDNPLDVHSPEPAPMDQPQDQPTPQGSNR